MTLPAWGYYRTFYPTGSDDAVGPQTADSMSEDKIDQIIGLMRHERYRFASTPNYRGRGGLSLSLVPRSARSALQAAQTRPGVRRILLRHR